MGSGGTTRARNVACPFIPPRGSSFVRGYRKEAHLTGAHSAAPNPDSGAWNDTATLLPSGTVLFAGGYDSNLRSSINSAELYHSDGISDSTTNLDTPRDG